MGNNQYAEGLKEWIISEDGAVDEDYCFDHQIQDLNKLINILEDYIDYQDEWRSQEPFNVNIYNLRPKDKIAKKGSLTYRMLNKIEDGIIFVSAKTIDFFKDDIEKNISFEDGIVSYIYEIKEGHKIYISAG